jgi:hypothetical protein
MCKMGLTVGFSTANEKVLVYLASCMITKTSNTRQLSSY